MNLATMRTQLRRRLNEQIASVDSYWTDTDLNQILNDSAMQIQKQVLKINPLAFIAWYRAPLTANESFYKRAVGSWWEYSVEAKMTTAAAAYKELRPKPYRYVRDLVDSQNSEGAVYARVGQYFFIGPPPKENVTDGLQVLHTPALTMALDTDSLDLHTSLHLSVVVFANMVALADMPEAPSRAVVIAELKGLLEDIPMIYGRETYGETDKLWVPPENIGRESVLVPGTTPGFHSRFSSLIE